MSEVHVEPSAAEKGEKFHIDGWQIKLIKANDQHGEAKPFQHVYAFVKNKQAMTRSDFEETQQAITDILDKEGVNSGILMFMHGTYVFTEVPVDLNPLIIKLADGINFNGDITTNLGNLDLVNSQMGRK